MLLLDLDSRILFPHDNRNSRIVLILDGRVHRVKFLDVEMFFLIIFNHIPCRDVTLSGVDYVSKSLFLPRFMLLLDVDSRT